MWRGVELGGYNEVGEWIGGFLGNVPAIGSEVDARQRRVWAFWLAAVGMVVAAGVSELVMGRSFLSKSGAIKFWVWGNNGPEMSQQVADFYSITHMWHGVFFYGVIWLVCRWRRWRFDARWAALWAVFLEAAWEVFENTPYTIGRFRAGTAAVGYTGDTVLNSVFDIVFCMLGFWIARALPVWATVLVVVVFEVALAFLVRDNLTLSTLMLIYPIESIKQWQMGGGG
jgi:hypothetical protein